MFTGFPVPPTRYNNSDFLLLQSYCYLYSWFCFHNKWHSIALGYISYEEQQWCCGGGDEGAEAAKRATGFRLPLGRGSGWCQWPVGKIHHQEGGWECCEKTHIESCYSSKMFSGFFYVCHRWKISCVSLSHCYQVDPEALTLIYNLRKLMRNDWVRRAQGVYENIMLKRFSINALSLSRFRLEAPLSPLCPRRDRSTPPNLPTCLKSCSERLEVIWLCFIICSTRPQAVTADSSLLVIFSFGY